MFIKISNCWSFCYLVIGKSYALKVYLIPLSNDSLKDPGKPDGSKILNGNAYCPSEILLSKNSKIGMTWLYVSAELW